MELFPQVVSGFRGELRMLPTFKMELFEKIVKNKKPFTVLQKAPSWMFDKFLNMLLNWLPKLRMFHF